VIRRNCLYARKSLSGCARSARSSGRGEDALAHMDVVALQALHRMLRVDEERRVKDGSDKEEDKGKSSFHLRLSPAREPHSPTTSPFSPLATHTPNGDEGDAGESHLISSLPLYM
jgi:hypothetical protein